MIASAQIIGKHIKGLSYYRNFISFQQKKLITSIINSKPWCNRLRRQQQYYGIKYFQTSYEDNILQNKQSLIEEDHQPLQSFQCLINKMTNQNLVFDKSYPPNQCLINKYLKHDYLGVHVEDKLCYGPIIAGISLGSQDYLRLNHQNQNDKKYYLELQDCSLYVLRDEARQEYKHGIGRAIQGKKYKEENFQRISLTFRHVIQTRRKL